MNKYEIRRVAKLEGLIYNSNVSNSDILKELNKILPNEGEDEISVTKTMARCLYEMKRYDEAILKYAETMVKKPEYSSSYLGLFKCFLRKGNISKSLDYLNTYENTLLKSGINYDIGLIFSMLNALENKSFNKVIPSDYYFTYKFLDENSKELYYELIESYNKKDFTKCLNIVSKLNKLKEEKRLCCDFDILAYLLEKLKKRERKEINKLYIELDEKVKNKDIVNLEQLLKRISNYSLQNRDLFFKGLYLLSVNGYEVALEILNNVYLILKSEKEYIKIIKSILAEKTKFDNLSEEEKYIYNYAYYYGKRTYIVRSTNIIKKYENAYIIYKYGYEKTNMPIFLYYMGKMCYKSSFYEEAKDLFLEYLKFGGEKMGKCYHYLKEILEKNYLYNQSEKYQDLLYRYKKLSNSDYMLNANQRTLNKKE